MKNKRMITVSELFLLIYLSKAKKAYNDISRRKDNLITLRFGSSENTTIVIKKAA